MFPFQDYKKISFSNIDSGDNELIYTTEWTHAFIIMEWQDVDINFNEAVRVYAEEPFNSVQDDIILGEASLSDSTENSDGFLRTYPVVLPSGVAVRASSGGENNFSGFLHVFRLPDL